MEFKIPVEVLKYVINKLSVVAKISDAGVLGMVLVTVDDDGVGFNVTDGNTHLIVKSTDCELIKNGTVLFKLNSIKGYVNKFTSVINDYGTDVFHFIKHDDVLYIKTKTKLGEKAPSYRKLSVELSDNGLFRKPKNIDKTDLIVNSSILKEGIRDVLHCVNPNEIHRALKGVAVAISSESITFAGTNGTKLVESIAPIAADIQQSFYILGYGFSSMLFSLLDPDNQVFITFEGSTIYLKSNDLYIIGSLIFNESYPDYKKVLEGYEKTIRIQKPVFYDNVIAATDVLDTEDHARLTMVFKGNEVSFTNNKISIQQEVETPFETELDVDVNGLYLASLLATFNSNYVDICFTPGGQSLVFKSAEDPNRTTLLTILRRR